MQRAKLSTLLACLCIAGPSVGCGGVPSDPDTPANVELGARERLIQLRTTLRQLRGGAYAEEAAPDLDMAESWLDDADAELRSDDRNEARFGLLLQAVHGQLVKVRSFYSRRESEAVLEAVREDYQGHRERIEELRDSEETK